MERSPSLPERAQGALTRRRHGSVVALVGLWLAAAGCKETDDPTVAPPPSSSQDKKLPAPRVASSPAAFDVAIVPGGAALLWGRPGKNGGGVRAQVVDRRGGATRDELTLRGGDDVVELAATSSGAHLAVVWRARTKGGDVARAVAGEITRSKIGKLIELGATKRAAPARRGNVDAAASDSGRLVVLHRAPDEACGSASTETCAGFRFHTLREDGSEPGLPLSVPSPCTRPIAGLAFAGERWHYGVCSLKGGTQKTTTFMIQYEPEYAKVEELLPGCDPLGITLAGTEPVLVGRCGRHRKGSRLRGLGGEPEPIDLTDVSVACSDGQPVIRSPGPYGLDVKLTGPAARVGPLLPIHVAPKRSRAVWTGLAFLVAAPVGSEVELRRYECERGALVRTDYG